MPQRLQRKHYRERMPPGSVGVSRPARFSNPFDVATYGSAAECVRLFKEQYEHDSVYRAEVVRRLYGKDLWCYCVLNTPCHADVLLRWANTPVVTSEAGRSQAVTELGAPIRVPGR